MKEFCTRGHLMADTRVLYGVKQSPACSACRHLHRETWGLNNPEREAELRHESRMKNAPHQRAKNIRLKYGLSVETFNELFEAQGERCAICGTSSFGTRAGKVLSAFIDHDHISGNVRGLLCRTCNVGIGAFGDSPELLLEAAAYLKGNQ